MLAIVTGADGGMGSHQTQALAKAGYKIIMVCYKESVAEPVRQRIMQESNNHNIEIQEVNLANMASVREFADEMLRRGEHIDVLMNNAGTLETHEHQTANGLEWTVSVNYVGHYLLTRLLLPLMGQGSRIVNMSSCSYLIGEMDIPEFFDHGRKGFWQRILVYSNTKLAVVLFTLRLAELVRESGIMVNAADPGIVDTGIISMHNWIDPLTDLFFRPFINTPAQGAATAIHLMTSPQVEGITGGYFKSCKQTGIPRRILNHRQKQALWDATEERVREWLT